MRSPPLAIPPSSTSLSNMSAALELSDLAVGPIGQSTEVVDHDIPQDAVLEPAAPAVVTGLAEADFNMSSRPPYKRHDSLGTLLNPLDYVSPDQEQKVDMPMPIPTEGDATVNLELPSVSYPPSIAVSQTESLPESLGMRRLRIFASFFVLFLAGWKLVLSPSCILVA